MKKSVSKNDKQITDLINYLQIQRETILNKWRTTCAENLIVVSKTSFSREEFNDQVPAILNILNQRLANEPEEAEVGKVAKEHGLHRWQRGYSLPELLVELDLLFNIVVEVINEYYEESDYSAKMVSRVFARVFSIFQEANRGSVLYYDELRQSNAAEQANATMSALHQLEELVQKRRKNLRESTHDLRSGFSTLFGVSYLLEMPSTEKAKTQLFSMLNRNLGSIRDMLVQLSDFSRIEAGQETLEIKEFDVAELLKDFIENAQPLAEHRKLVLKGEGPANLKVNSDPVKIQRILQNLVHNALKYTKEGGIYISWVQENDTRWILSVQDTGPGFAVKSPEGLLVEQLKPLNQVGSSHRAGSNSEYPLEMPPSTDPVKVNTAYKMKESEGLGLFIVKKLCELLKANMDMESSSEHGTLVRITFLSNHK